MVACGKHSHDLVNLSRLVPGAPRLRDTLKGLGEVDISSLAG